MKIKVENNFRDDHNLFYAMKDSSEEMQQFINMQKAKGDKCPWGKPAHELIVDEKVKPREDATFIEEVTYTTTELDENGQEQEVEVTKYKYSLPDEFTITYDSQEDDFVQNQYNKLREERDAILRSTDHTQLADAPYESSVKSQYRNYRTYLRNLPAQHNDNTIKTYAIQSFEEFVNG